MISMTKYKSYSILKNNAKIKLDGFFGLAITTGILLQCISYIATTLVNTFVPGYDTTSTILSLLLSGVASVFVGALNTGLAYFYLSLSCGKPCNSSVLFYGYKTQPEKSVKVSLVHALVNFICLTPSSYLLLVLIQNKTMENLIIWLIAFGIGYAVYIPISLLLSQTWYLLVDFPNYSAKDVLLTSCKLMKKHFWRLLFLKISFLPIMLLGILSFGLGLLWIVPYKEMTYASFYLDIMNPGQEN